MTDSTESLIASLAEEMEPVTPASRPLALFVKWLAGSLAYTLIVLLYFGLRRDLFLHLHTPLYLAETGLLACLVVTSGISAVTLSFPDLYQRRWAVFTPVLPLLLFLATLYIEWLHDSPPAPEPPHGMDCLLCISMFSVLPAALLMLLLRRQASTHYYLAGGIALLAATSIGCLTLRLSEDTDSILHLIKWHYLPMIGFSFLGIRLGRKLLKW
jgi:hypothetical protein